MIAAFRRQTFTRLSVLCLWLLAACAAPATVSLPVATLQAKTEIVEPISAPTMPAETPTQPAAPLPSANPDITVQIDLTQTGYPISPLIYGMTGAPVEMMQALHLPLRSWGGNPASRYNWKLGNAWNAGHDFVFLNGDYGYKGKSAANDFIREDMDAGAATRLTVPTLGWVAKDTSSCSFPNPSGQCSVGNNTRCDKPGGSLADPHKTSVEAPPQFIGEWMDQLNTDGLQVQYFAMDNEPELWGITHYDVHPTCTTYDEILQRFTEYAQVVKAKEPQGQILGPVTCCWYYYFNSMAGEADKQAHGNMDFLPWFLQKMAEYDQQNGQRLLDVLDIHYYPEGVYNDDTSPAIAAQRLRATRSLWDPSYKDESWIDQPVYLIPRMRKLIDQYYPGTKLSISEWNFGADETMNGALAIAEVLGIFGREQLDMAAYYRYPKPDSPGFFAFKMFTNYDGQGSRFGDTSVPALSSDSKDVSVFAAKDSATGRAMVMLINTNLNKEYTVQVSAKGMPVAGKVRLYRYDQQDLAGIHTESIDPAGLQGVELPPYSLTLLVMEPGNG